MTEQRKAVIKNANMSESMQQDAVDCASQALAKYNIEKVRINQFYFLLYHYFYLLLLYVCIIYKREKERKRGKINFRRKSGTKYMICISMIEFL